MLIELEPVFPEVYLVWAYQHRRLFIRREIILSIPYVPTPYKDLPNKLQEMGMSKSYTGPAETMCKALEGRQECCISHYYGESKDTVL